MALSIITLIISIIVFLSVIIGLIIYTVYKLRKDLVLFKKIAPVSSGTPTNGTNGTDGISAYQKYMLDNPLPVLTEAQFEALFTGADGIDGTNAPAALDGSDADTGSTGMHGEMGIIGINGNKGAPGMKGLHGETFFNFYDGVSVPTDIKNYCSINNSITANNSTIEYYEDSVKIFSALIEVHPSISGLNVEMKYISFILYNPDDTIKGITGPVNIKSFINIDINYLNIIDGVSTSVNPIPFRYIISRNKYLTSSSFSRHIIDKEYDNQDIIYLKNEENDPFIVKLYDLISVNNNLEFEVDRLETIFISKKQISDGSQIDLFPAIYF